MNLEKSKGEVKGRERDREGGRQREREKEGRKGGKKVKERRMGMVGVLHNIKHKNHLEFTLVMLMKCKNGLEPGVHCSHHHTMGLWKLPSYKDCCCVTHCYTTFT